MSPVSHCSCPSIHPAFQWSYFGKWALNSTPTAVSICWEYEKLLIFSSWKEKYILLRINAHTHFPIQSTVSANEEKKIIRWSFPLGMICVANIAALCSRAAESQLFPYPGKVTSLWAGDRCLPFPLMSRPPTWMSNTHKTYTHMNINTQVSFRVIRSLWNAQAKLSYQPLLTAQASGSFI